MSKFTIVDEEWICYASGGYAYTVSNGKCEFVLWEDKNDTQKICDWLNEQQAEKSELSQKNIDLLEDKIRSVKEFEKCIDTLIAKIAEQKIIIEQQNKVIDNIYDSYESYYGMSLRDTEWLKEFDIDD